MTTPHDARPLSPHLGIYRWQITNTMSILHRMTGVGLSAGLVLFCAWLVAAAWCPSVFALIQDALASTIGNLFLFGWTAAFFYHLGNGMRHLNWDMGKGFALPEMRASGRLIVMFTLTMTLITWAVALKKVVL